MEGKSRRRRGRLFSCRGRWSKACVAVVALASGSVTGYSVRSGGMRTGGVAIGLNGLICLLGWEKSLDWKWRRIGLQKLENLIQGI
jgi:hypothetical protein